MKINYQFLTYNDYDNFINDLNDGRIREDSIVFIKSNLRIWAHGKEYFCDGSATAVLDDNTLTFKNGLDDVIFSVSEDNGTITFTDSLNNTISATFVLDEDFKTELGKIQVSLDSINHDIESNREELSRVAFTGDYNDLLHSPDPIAIDSNISSTSTNPVQNKVIYSQLQLKANASSLLSYVSTEVYLEGLREKQGTLTAGSGIEIDPETNVISTAIDTTLYIIVTELPDASEADPDKIYLLETSVGNGEYTYQQYRAKNSTWILVGQATPDIDLSDYLKTSDAELRYQLKRSDYVISSDLSEYAKDEAVQLIIGELVNFVQYEYLQLNYQRKGNYATNQWTIDNFVRKADVYSTLNNGQSESNQSDPIVIPEEPVYIVVDDQLSIVSSNPVENRVVTAALQGKVDTSTLRNYATKDELENKVDNIDLSNYVSKDTYNTGINSKQNTLIPGSGISIINDVISSTLDTDVFVITDSLSNITNPSPNKVYLVETTQNNETVYIEWRYVNNNWVEVGRRDPEINLSSYLSKSEAQSTYQPIGDYLTRTEASSTYLPIITDYATKSELLAVEDQLDDYVLDSAFEALRLNINLRFLKKGNYVLAQDVSNALIVLQLIIDQKYVLKKDVSTPSKPGGWSSGEPTLIDLGGSNGGSGGGVNVQNNMVTLTTLQYLSLVDNNLIDENTYYFTYEADETNNWTFGDTFPIIFHEESGIGTFPIVLGEDNIGTFPINLT